MAATSIYAGNGENFAAAGSGNDHVYDYEDNHRLYGCGALDHPHVDLELDKFHCAQANDKLLGDDGNDTLVGAVGAKQMRSAAGNEAHTSTR